MTHVRTQFAISIVLFGVAPAAAIADSGEGLLEVLILGALYYVNIFWPILLPMFFLKRAKKKFSSYIYSVAACGMLSWLLTYFAPHQLVGWQFPEITLEALRIVLLCVVFASVLAIFISLGIVPKIREFNDTHE